MRIGEQIKNYRKTEGLTQEPVSYTHLMLGFNTYMGFGDKIRGELGEDKDGMLKRIYEYVKKMQK